MSASILLISAVFFAIFVAIAAGWLLWGRPLRARDGELIEKRDALSRALVEVAAFKSQAEIAQPFVARATELESHLSTARAQMEERERAANEAAAERERFHAQVLSDRERHYREAAEERERNYQAQMGALKSEFQQLAAEALARAQKQFTEQASETLKLHRAEAQKGLADSKEALSQLVQPMRDTLGRYGEELKALESKREQAYGTISEQLAQVAIGQETVRHEAGKIVAALRSSSKASGAWGEAQLRNVLEMAGLREGIDFELQASTTDEEGRRRRPDAILKLPGGRELVIDSKCSLADYLAASEAVNDGDRRTLLKRHAASVRAHARGLSERAYWKEFAHSADFVVLFVPGENFLSAALEHDLDLLGWAQEQRILLAGPINLLGLARVVASVWRQEKIADEARQIGQLGADLYASLATMAEHIGRVGKNLGDASNAYNDFIGSLERNVLSKARRFPELGVEPGKKAVPELAPIDKSLRMIQSPHLLHDAGEG